jgi:hypothetical protein
MRNAGPIRNSNDPDPTSPAPARDLATASPPLASPQESLQTRTEGVTRQPSSSPVRCSTSPVSSSDALTVA